jgi:hypothetical protein
MQPTIGYQLSQGHLADLRQNADHDQLRTALARYTAAMAGTGRS